MASVACVLSLVTLTILTMHHQETFHQSVKNSIRDVHVRCQGDNEAVRWVGWQFVAAADPRLKVFFDILLGRLLHGVAVAGEQVDRRGQDIKVHLGGHSVL